MTATNDNAFSAKHTASLVNASSTPATAGPTTRAVLTSIEFSAIAFGEIAAVGDEMHVHRLTQRQVERRARAEPQREDDQMPRLDPPEPDEHRQHDRLHEHQRLRDEQPATPIDPVGEHAGIHC